MWLNVTRIGYADIIEKGLKLGMDEGNKMGYIHVY